MKAVIVLCALAGVGQSQPPAADEIMVRVAENQDRAQEMRAFMVYNQNLLIRMKRGNGKLAREEIRDFTVIPTATGLKKDLTHFAGKYENKGKWVEYGKPGFEYKSIDIDGDLLNDLANDLTNDRKSRDGISADLFPLTRKQQEKYLFTLEGREHYGDHDVFRITFKPKKASLVDFDDGECAFWAGEALVDVREYQPVWLRPGQPRKFLSQSGPSWARISGILVSKWRTGSSMKVSGSRSAMAVSSTFAQCSFTSGLSRSR